MHTPSKPRIGVLKSKAKLKPVLHSGRQKMKRRIVEAPNNLEDMIPEELLSDFFGELQVVGVDITYIMRPKTVEEVEYPVTFQSFDLF